MNELEPETEASQRLWFCATLAAMTIIALVVGYPPLVEERSDNYRGDTIMLSRLRKLVFKIRPKTSAARFAESMRRVNRLARLMTIMQQRGRRKVGG
jgi:hypothetical protein